MGKKLFLLFFSVINLSAMEYRMFSRSKVIHALAPLQFCQPHRLLAREEAIFDMLNGELAQQGEYLLSRRAKPKFAVSFITLLLAMVGCLTADSHNHVYDVSLWAMMLSIFCILQERITS